MDVSWQCEKNLDENVTSVKIVRITNFLDFGGVEKHFELVARANSDHEYIFVSLGSGGRTEQVLKGLGYQVYCLDRNVRIPNLALVKYLTKLLENIRPDVVHTSAAEANFHGILAGYFSKIPVRLAEEIGIPDHSPIARLVFRLIYRMATCVIGVSQSVSEYLVSVREVPREKTITILNPAHISIRSEQFKKSDGFCIVTVCRLTPIKNLDFLLQAISDLRKENRLVHLIIVGDGPEKTRLEQLSEKWGISQSVHFTGFSDNPGYYMSIADLFVLPSFSEGFAIALVEAMLVGLPCLSTNCGGPSEILQHGKTGWLFDPADYPSFYLLLSSVISLSVKERNQVAKAGKTYAEKNFSPAAYIHKIHALYDRLKK